jgi:F-type H+-transporting ATPase subunit a
MDFSIHVWKTFELFGVEIWITESMINSWIISGVLILIALGIRMAIKNPKKVPEGIQNVAEFLVDSLDKFAISTMGKHGKKFGAFYGSMIIYLMICNISGLFLGPNIGPVAPGEPKVLIDFMRPPTADFAVTFALALITFAMVQGLAVKEHGVLSWLKGLTEPMWPLTPLNVIGELANPISLSFRLFGNILGGTIIMGLYYNLPWFVLLGIPVALHAYFDIFAGLLQAFIFVMLSMTFVSSAMDG